MHVETESELGVSMKELSRDVTAVVQMILTKLASMNFVAVPPNRVSKAFDVYRRDVLMEAELLIDRAAEEFLRRLGQEGVDHVSLVREMREKFYVVVLAVVYVLQALINVLSINLPARSRSTLYNVQEGIEVITP